MSDEVVNASSPATAPVRLALLGPLLRGAGACCAVLAVLIVAFLALRPEPEIKRLTFFPRELALFFDRHDFLKNVIGFAILRLALAAALAPWTARLGGGTWRCNLRLSAAAGALVVGLELVQLTLPKRTFDWNDIAAGLLGVAAVSLALGLTAAAGRLLRAKFKKEAAT